MQDNTKIIKILKNTRLLWGVFAVICFWVGVYAFNWPPDWCTPGSCTTPLTQDYANQRVGIANSSPQEALDVAGGVRIGQLPTASIEAIMCTGNTLGTLIYDTDENVVKICKSTGWENRTGYVSGASNFNYNWISKTAIASGANYTIYEIALSDCANVTGWKTGISYSDVGEWTWWESYTELPLNESNMNNCVDTQATWWSDGASGVQALIANLGSSQAVTHILVGGEQIESWWDTVNYIQNADLQYYDWGWQNLLTFPVTMNNDRWYIVELSTPLNTSHVRLKKDDAWIGTNNFRIAVQE